MAHPMDDPEVARPPVNEDKLSRITQKYKQKMDDNSEFPRDDAVWYTNVGLARNIFTGLRVYATSNPEYVEWVLNMDAIAGMRQSPPFTVAEWFQHLCSNDAEVRRANDSLHKRFPDNSKVKGSVPPRNRIFVPRAIGLRYGPMMRLLIQRRTDRGKALFVAFYGIRNPASCSSCVRRAVATGVPQSRGPPMTESYPFDECVSLSGHWSDACANCHWHVDNGNCSYYQAFINRLPIASRSGRESGTGFRGLDKTLFADGATLPPQEPRRLHGLQRRGEIPAGPLPDSGMWGSY